MPVACGVERPVKNIILMISDGQGYNGWLASDYYQYGTSKQQSYQKIRPDGTKAIHVAKAQQPGFFIDVSGDSIASIDKTGQGILVDEFVIPPDAVAMGQQIYKPESFWKNATIEQSQGKFMDSAASATALASGSWTTNGRLNTSWDTKTRFKTVAQLAKEQGKKAGIVSTVQVSHATPAGMISRQIRRNEYAQIFQEMLSELDLIMGCGHPLFDNHGQAVIPEDDLTFRFLGGEDCFTALKNAGADTHFSDSLESFYNFASRPVSASKIVAVAPIYETLQQRRLSRSVDKHQPSGTAKNRQVPSLELMTKGAIQNLKQSKEGFFLMIEGGAIDWAHHEHDFARALEEQLDFNQAVDAVIDWVECESSWQETLLIVTADHETGCLWGQVNLPEEGEIDIESLEAYLKPPDTKGQGVMPDTQYLSLGHSNNLVPLWALGANSELFLDTSLSDPWAARLWGEHYGWNGQYVEATGVFKIMREAIYNSRPVSS